MCSQWNFEIWSYGWSNWSWNNAVYASNSNALAYAMQNTPQHRQRHQRHPHGNSSRPSIPPLHPDGQHAQELLTNDTTTRICAQSRPHQVAPPPHKHQNDIHRTPPPAGRTETPHLCTPQAGDHLDATRQVLHVGDKVSFHATSYTAGGTGTVKCFTATFIIIRRGNGGDICHDPSNITRLCVPIY